MALSAAKAPPATDFLPLRRSPPKFWFGEIVRDKRTRQRCEVVGLSWQKTNDPTCLDGWYYHLRLLNTNSSHFHACRIGGQWAEDMGHETDLTRIRK